MNEKIFKLDSPQGYRLKVIAASIIGIGAVPLLFILIGKMSGATNDITRWSMKIWQIAVVMCAIGTAWAIYLSYWYQTKLTLTHIANKGLDFFMREPNGDETRATGTWKWYAYYTKEYARYGMYRKVKHLVLFNKDKAFIMFRSDVGVMLEPKEPYVLMPGELKLSAHTYHAANNIIDDLLTEFASSYGAEQIQPNINNNGGNPGIKVTSASIANPATTPEPIAPPKREGAPEYGDPDYDL